MSDLTYSVMSDADTCGTHKILPNINVTTGKDSDDSYEEGEICETESATQDTNISKQEIVRNWMNTLQSPDSRYKNKMGGFETGIDLSSPSLQKKLEERAERFGLDKSEKKQITPLEIDDLYESLGLDPKNLKLMSRNIRLKVIHVRGVTNMNTKEVLDYFQDYGPSTIEWINDISCNVCFADEFSSARALIALSKPFINKGKKKNQESLEEFDTEIDNVKETQKSREEAYWKEADDCKMEIDAQSYTNSDEDTDSANIDMPVPPGHWRLGVSHKKAKALLLRFGNNDDKKIPGAEKRSKYYQKHGNPNYGGLKGHISSSRKRKIQSIKNKEFISKISEIPGTSSSSYDRDVSSEHRQRSKMPRMKMYADEEEERIRARRSDFGRPSSIKDRLGKVYTKEDMLHIRRDYYDDEEEEDSPEEISVNCKIPAKFKIWNEQAKLMGEAERRNSGALRGDLRSKINFLDDSPNKHRSPLLRGDD